MDEKTDRADAACALVVSKDHTAPSVFQPDALLREARRQKGLPLVARRKELFCHKDCDRQRHLSRTNHSDRSNAVLHPDRPRRAR